mmetsp:Transcript_18670/g.50165  ORF Transcript_18670/g.50165 Transcript_18670/m.50165 type:complete len:201 (-) Transcript_18670:15-617(-)
MPAEGAYAIARADAPQPCRAVGRGGQQKEAVRRKDGGIDPAPVPLEGALQPLGRDLPQLGGRVGGRGGDVRPAGRELRAAHVGVLVPAERPLAGAVGDAPDPGHPVGRGGQHAGLVAGEDGGVEPADAVPEVVRPVEGARALAARHAPELRAPVVARRQQGPAVARELPRHDGPSVAQEALQAGLRGRAPYLRCAVVGAG